MDYLPIPAGARRLGQSDITVSPIAWGLWRFKGAELPHTENRVRAVLDAGITFFDTADIYGETFGESEALLGRVLKAAPGLRSQMVLATKGGIERGVPYNSSASYLVAACDASLARLGTDHVELYQIHRPDLLAHPEEVASALTQLRDSGKIRAGGVSNFTVSQVSALQSYLSFPLVSHQIEFSPLAIEPLSDGTLDQAMEHKIEVLAWSPLAGGRLGGSGEDDRSRAVIAVLDRIAAEQDKQRASVAHAWLLAHPARVIPIAGTQQPERIAQIPEALSVKLTRQEWYEVLTASRQRRLP